MTMKNLYTFLLIGASTLALGSCSKFEEINTNPETTNVVTPAMIATRVIVNMANQPSQKAFMMPYLLNKNIVWTEFVESYQYNGGFNSGQLNFTSINDLASMVKFAPTEKLAKSYEGLMYFSRALKFFNTTMDLGDIPYAEALKGESDKNYFPKYDTQKDVLLGVLKELELADKAFSEGENFSGDPIYKGNTTSWRKLTNSFMLHVLIQLSKKESDADLNIKSRFRTIVANKPIFASNSDNYELKRANKSGQLYPFYKVGNNFTIYPIISSEIIEPLKSREDRRLFFYANPSEKRIAEGKSPAAFDAYAGIDPSLPFDVVTSIKNTKDFSKLNNRYLDIPTGEPTQQLSYAQLCFVIAEAATRGWIADQPVDWYKKGIQASMEFIQTNTPNTEGYTHGMPLSNDYIASHVQKMGSKFPTATEARIEEIITEKYLASFLQSEFMTYYDYRRTGYPKWKINPSTSLNSEAPTKIPVRWKYPAVENNYNSQHLDEAVKRQFNGTDDINQLIWLLK